MNPVARAYNRRFVAYEDGHVCFIHQDSNCYDVLVGGRMYPHTRVFPTNMDARFHHGDSVRLGCQDERGQLWFILSVGCTRKQGGPGKKIPSCLFTTVWAGSRHPHEQNPDICSTDADISLPEMVLDWEVLLGSRAFNNALQAFPQAGILLATGQSGRRVAYAHVDGTMWARDALTGEALAVRAMDEGGSGPVSISYNNCILDSVNGEILNIYGVPPNAETQTYPGNHKVARYNACTLAATAVSSSSMNGLNIGFAALPNVGEGHQFLVGRDRFDRYTLHGSSIDRWDYERMQIDKKPKARMIRLSESPGHPMALGSVNDSNGVLQGDRDWPVETAGVTGPQGALTFDPRETAYAHTVGVIGVSVGVPLGVVGGIPTFKGWFAGFEHESGEMLWKLNLWDQFRPGSGYYNDLQMPGNYLEVHVVSDGLRFFVPLGYAWLDGDTLRRTCYTVCVDAKTGLILWSKRVDQTITAGPPDYPDELIRHFVPVTFSNDVALCATYSRVYYDQVGAKNRVTYYLTGLNVSTGQVLWEQPYSIFRRQTRAALQGLNDIQATICGSATSTGPMGEPTPWIWPVFVTSGPIDSHVDYLTSPMTGCSIVALNPLTGTAARSVAAIYTSIPDGFTPGTDPGDHCYGFVPSAPCPIYFANKAAGNNAIYSVVPKNLLSLGGSDYTNEWYLQKWR